jgi:alkanesulfonate monooxygenase SsuD/methylene tetrahydromethanopterin reductase-like flavin-dependent oxidoreductase (luciferase family)
MEYGVVLPNLAAFGGPLPSLADLLEYARAARAAGFQSAWAADHVMHVDPTYYAPVVLQAVATAVPDIKVGFASMPAFIRHPIAAARVIATLEILTEGRLEVGLSIGNQRPEMRAMGVRASERGRRLDETLAILMRLASDEDEVTFQGAFYGFERAHFRPKPLQAPVAARLFIASWTGNPSIERMLTYRCGWMASGLFSRQEDLERGMADLRRAAAERGAPVPSTIVTNVLTCISSESRTIERAHAVVNEHPHLANVRGVRLIGTPDEVKQRLATIRQLGFERLNVLPVNFDVTQFEAFMRLT